ncbi:unnamed protein product [Dibothriocephalus latus]|uniref:Uncharacterized protein n=1 Tax=Dibothriocephalus latus TaxID=60516 RepID=A0A3P7L383_DIBLA|nr:unnamed protein product [Dibothriocephalus latus]
MLTAPNPVSGSMKLFPCHTHTAIKNSRAIDDEVVNQISKTNQAIDNASGTVRDCGSENALLRCGCLKDVYKPIKKHQPFLRQLPS